MLEGSLSLFLMRLFSQMYKCHKPQKHYHKTWLHNSSVSLYCVTRIYYILFLSALHTSPQAPPGPTHSSLSSLHSTVSQIKQSSEGRVMACTLWLHKGRPGKQSFSSHHIIIRLFALVTRERVGQKRSGNTETGQGLLHLLHHTQHLASPVYGPALLQQEHWTHYH